MRYQAFAVSFLWLLSFSGCATRPSNLAGVEVQNVKEITVCDETNGSAGFLGGAVGEAAGKAVDKDSGSVVGGLLGYYLGMKIGCEVSKRPGQMLTVQDAQGQVSEIKNDARRNGFFKAGDRVTYEGESRWADLASDTPWIKKIQP
jgi:outer membrane lipoprotein SlyB